MPNHPTRIDRPVRVDVGTPKKSKAKAIASLSQSRTNDSYTVPRLSQDCPKIGTPKSNTVPM